VHNDTVGKLRASLAGSASESPKTYTTKHGTTAIGGTKRPALAGLFRFWLNRR
jgi:hypothetical protein